MAFRLLGATPYRLALLSNKAALFHPRRPNDGVSVDAHSGTASRATGAGDEHAPQWDFPLDATDQDEVAI